VVIKCILSVSLKSIKHFAGQLSELPPLPWYITKRGPYINGTGGADNRITTSYEFDKSRLVEAGENILKQLDVLRGVPGLSLSAQIWEEDTEVKNSDLVERIARILKAESDPEFPPELTADSIDPGEK